MILSNCNNDTIELSYDQNLTHFEHNDTYKQVLSGQNFLHIHDGDNDVIITAVNIIDLEQLEVELCHEKKETVFTKCNLSHSHFPSKIGSLLLEGSDLTNCTLPSIVVDINISNCVLENTAFPNIIEGSITAINVDLTKIKIPDNFKGKIITE